jgi:hypothetical protein
VVAGTWLACYGLKIEWHQFEEELLAVAERQAAQNPQVSGPAKSIIEICAKFLHGSLEHPDLLAHWESRQDQWMLLNAPTGEVMTPADPGPEHLFKETARIAVGLLGMSGDKIPSYHVWLDLMRKEKRGYRRILKPRAWSQFKTIAESEEPRDLSDVPLSENGQIAHVFKASADFCEDLAANLAGGVTPDHSQNQSTQSASEMYDPVWNVRGGGDDPETPRESFKRLARRAVVALGHSFTNRSEAVDVWLSRLHEFHAGRKSRRYAPEHWRVNHVLEASAEYCAELGTCFHEARNSEAERTFADLERQFRESPDARADLTAIRRRETCLEDTGAELTQPATGVATKGRTIGHVFKESADFRDELAARTHESEKAKLGDYVTAAATSHRASPEQTLEANSGEAAPAEEASVVNSGHGTNRPAVVDAFLLQCNQEPAVGFKVIRKHIWLAVGHRHARQFQYWQEGSDKATDEDDRNFRRILSMPPAEFISLLKKKGIGS